MWHSPEVAKHFSQQLSKKLHGVFRWIFGHPEAIPPLFPSCQVTSPAAAFAGARTLTCDTWHTDLLWCACDLMECIDHMIQYEHMTYGCKNVFSLLFLHFKGAESIWDWDWTKTIISHFSSIWPLWVYMSVHSRFNHGHDMSWCFALQRLFSPWHVAFRTFIAKRATPVWDISGFSGVHWSCLHLLQLFCPHPWASLPL